MLYLLKLKSSVIVFFYFFFLVFAGVDPQLLRRSLQGLRDLKRSQISIFKCICSHWLSVDIFWWLIHLILVLLFPLFLLSSPYKGHKFLTFYKTINSAIRNINASLLKCSYIHPCPLL